MLREAPSQCAKAALSDVTHHEEYLGRMSPVTCSDVSSACRPSLAPAFSAHVARHLLQRFQRMSPVAESGRRLALAPASPKAGVAWASKKHLFPAWPG